MNQATTSKRRRIHDRILRWYRRTGRDLPWRKTRNPYRILISELMLQQTQVSRVESKYREFLKVFPSLRRLSKASRGTVLRHWQGLGYNRRAIWLHELAREISDKHNGRFPRDYSRLLALKGIGDYTARAIRCFAFGEPEAVVDVNIRRILSRVLGSSPATITSEVAHEFLPLRRAYDWNQALMDLGSLICTARNPGCGECPLREDCASSGVVRTPTRRTRKKEPERHGIPRRIYRGRVLRAVTLEKELTARSLATAVGLGTSNADMRWLRALVNQMHREGMIELRSIRSSWSVRRVA